MGKAAGYREQQLEYARIIGANTEADIVRKREHNRRLMEGKLADHVGAVPLERHRSALEANWDMTARKYNQGRCNHE